MRKRLLILACYSLLLPKALGVQLDLQGPVFVHEPPHRMEFSSTSGGKVDCQAHGVPFPVLEWILADGTPVTGISDIRIVQENGSLVFPPFPPDKFRHDVHAAVYRCIASNQLGLILSKDVFVKAVVDQKYDVHVYDEHVISGNTAVMRCQVPSYLSDHILVTSWIQDNIVHIYPTADTGGKYVVVKTGELFILNVTPTDAYKRYSCRTVNKLTGKSQSNSQPARVIITEGTEAVPPRLGVDKHSTRHVRSEEDVVLECTAQGYPVPTYRWFREEKEGSFPVEFNQRFVEIADGVLLRITKVKLQDSGKYFCSVNNSVGKETVHVNLVVLVSLSVHVQPQSQVIDMKKEAKFSCMTGGFPVSSVTWVHNGKPVEESERHEIRSHPDSLLVKRLQKNDYGMYQCIISNEWDMVQSSAELQLGDASPELLSWFTEQTFQPGPSLSLKCSANGNPPPQFYWTLDGFPVPDNNRFMIGQYITINDDVITHLNISSTEEGDGGEYTCTAKNSISETSHSARINIYGRPYIRRMPKVNAVAGVDLIIKCAAAGYPIELITWEKGGVFLPFNHRQKVFSNGTLLVENVEKDSDSGTYTCQAKNNHRESDRRDVEVHVLVPPKILPIQGIVLREGMRAAITCQITEGDLPFKFRWEKNGETISGSKLEIRRVDEYTSLLVVDNVSTVHTGNYTCFAENVAGKESFTVPLTVKVAPKWEMEPVDTSAVAGLDVIIDCQATGFPVPSIVWKKSIGSRMGEYREFLYEPNISIYSNGSLKLTKVSKKNEGHYLCEAKNNVGSGVSKLIYLKVNLKAHFTEKTKQMQVVQGEEAHLQCPAIGDVPIEIRWKFNGQKIFHGKETRYIMREQSLDEGMVSELSIPETRRQDTGVFSCYANNAFGQDEMKIQLIVQETPEAPINVRVNDQGSRSVEIAWIQPYAGNSPIISYIVQFKLVDADWENNSEKLVLPGTKTSATVQNLQPAQSYHVRVFAENRLGKSEPSHGIQITTQEEAPSGAPVEVSAVAESSTEIKVTWEPPTKSKQNGKLLGYYVGYQEQSSGENLVPTDYDFQKVESYNQNHLSTVLGNLNKFTTYSIIVQAFTNKGAGPFSTPVTAKTKEDVPTSSPRNVNCKTLSSQSIEIRWESPDPAGQHGLLLGYKLAYQPTDKWNNGEDVETKVTTLTKTIISGLLKYTNYSMTLLAFTSAGDGVEGDPIFCATDQDVPSPPEQIKAAMSSPHKIIVTWLPPKHKNGEIICYTIYMSSIENGKEEGTHKRILGPETRFYETPRHKEKATYEFWLTASTKIGEGESSKVVTLPLSDKVPARIMSFSENIVTPWKKTLNLTCRKVGLPIPQSVWKFNHKTLAKNGGRHQVQRDGSLIIKDVLKSDQGNYSCSVENYHGKDEITYRLVVRVPPERPKVSVVSSTSDSLQLEWAVDGDTSDNKILGYVINYKRDHGDWEELQLGPKLNTYLLKSLRCATRYQLYITAFNKIGMGLPCDIVNTYTLGDVPVKPEGIDIKVNATSASVGLGSWLDGGCPILYFVIETQVSHSSSSSSWFMASNNEQSQSRVFTISNLLPATRYRVRITAHNNAGSSVAVYNFTTSGVPGVPILPSKETEISNSDVPFYSNQMSIITLALAVSSGCMILIATISFIRKKRTIRQTISNSDESSSAAQTQNDLHPDHQYISIEDRTKFPSDQKSPIAIKEDDYTTQICPYAAYKISKPLYSECSYRENIYNGAYNSVKSSFPFQDFNPDSYRLKSNKGSAYMRNRRKSGKFRDLQLENQESDNLGSTDSEVKRIFSMHLPISEYDTLGSDSEPDPRPRNSPPMQEHAPFRHASTSAKRAPEIKTRGDDSSNSSDTSQNELKLSTAKPKSKTHPVKNHVRSSSGYSSHTDETTFSSQPTLKLACNMQPRLKRKLVESDGKSKGKHRSSVKGNASVKFSKEASFEIDV